MDTPHSARHTPHPPGSLTDVPGVLVGHDTDPEGGTGCTVVLAPEGARAGAAVRGGASGTREIDLLRPDRLVQEIHAVLLTGGSAFGLAAADGVMRWLEARGIGFDAGLARVPIVPAAVLFDLHVGRADRRPDAAWGYRACERAGRGPVETGSVGAGTGSTVGKLLGLAHAMKGGVGTASIRLRGGAVVGALAVVNALGDVVDPATGRIVAGARGPDGGFAGAQGTLHYDFGSTPLGATNTTLAVVATDARLDKAALAFVADMAHDGLARAIRPAHTLFDGDTVFALSTGDRPAEASLVGAAAAEAVARSILQAVRAASTLHGIPAASA